MKFVAIGYGDRAGYDRTPSKVRDAAHEHDTTLRTLGAVIGIAGEPVQVRNPEALGVKTQDGPFLTSNLPIAGFTVIEASSLTEVIEFMSKTPCAIAHGVVEIWPITAV